LGAETIACFDFTSAFSGCFVGAEFVGRTLGNSFLNRYQTICFSLPWIACSYSDFVGFGREGQVGRRITTSATACTTAEIARGLRRRLACG
jgi:hypothetical protein